MSRIVHFEIPADNPEESTRFYEEVFGWKFDKWDGPIDYYMASTGDRETPGIDGAVAPRDENFRIPTIVHGVEDIDAMSAKIEANGGRIVMPKSPVPGMGWTVYYADPSGNVLGMFQGDPSAG